MQSTEKPITLDTLKYLFHKSADIRFQNYTFYSQSVVFITCEAMIDSQLLNEVIVPRVRLVCNYATNGVLEEAVDSYLHIPSLSQPKTRTELITLLYTGNILLYFEDTDMLFASDISKKPNRSPEETRLEIPVKGPRDNFIEDVAINIALIRKRLPTHSLCVEKFELGKRSKTTVALLYFDDIASKETLLKIRQNLQSIDVDIVFSGELLMENMGGSTKLFPTSDTTGRPDNAIQSLARGRFVIMMDGVAYAIVIPVNLFLLLKSPEDNENTVFFSSFQRLLRTVSLFAGLLLPSFWLALTTFHQNQIPIQLLSTVVQANIGLPFPSVFEMLLMLGLFELFREAGLRLPSVIGSTIGVVGGIIIGDAAIRAGLTSPAMIVIIATSTIASYTLVNQSVVTSISILRVFSIILTGVMGLFGFYLSFFFVLLYLAHIRTFGVPYLNITADLTWNTLTTTIFRLPATAYKKRPSMLNPEDQTRRKEEHR